MKDEVTGAAAPEVSAQKREASIFDMFETDENVELKGVLLRYSPTIRILVARAGGANKKFERIVKELTKPCRQLVKAVQGGTASDADAKLLDDIMQQAYANTVVMGWEGIQLERNGPMVEYSPEACLALFKKIPQLWFDVRDFASNYMNFLTVAEDVEEVVKN